MDRSLGKGYWCIVPNCYNKRGFSDIVFFSLPKEKSRLNLWLDNCGRNDLLNTKVGKAHVMCAAHFDQTEFMDPSCKRLKPCAVPRSFPTAPQGALAHYLSSAYEKRARDPNFLKSLICQLTNADQTTEETSEAAAVPGLPAVDDTPVESSPEVNTPQPAWNDAAVMMLIETYKKYRHMFQQNSVRKKDVWLMISKEMVANGFNFSREVCDKKWHNLLITYRRLVDSNKTLGTGKRTWVHFEKMDELLRNDSTIAPLYRGTRATPAKIAKAPESQPSVPVVQISILPSTTSTITTPSCLLLSNAQMPAPTNTIQLPNSITTVPQGFPLSFDNATKPKKARTAEADNELLNFLEDERYENRIWREEMKQILKQSIEEQRKTASAVIELTDVIRQWIKKDT